MATHKQIERYLVFAFGIIFIGLLVLIAFFKEEPTPFQWFIFRIVIGLAAAGFAAFIPGFLEVKVPNYIRAGGAIAIFVIIYFFEPASFVAEKPQMTRAEQSVLDLKDDVLILRGSWEAWTPGSKTKVASEAPLLAEALLKIPDSELREGHQIEKYYYATYAYVMACEAHSNPSRAEAFCDSAVEKGQQFKTAVQLARSSETKSDYHKAVAEWTRKSRHDDRANYQLALAHALLYRISSQPKNAELAEQYYTALSPKGRQDHPLDDSKIIAPVIQDLQKNLLSDQR